MPTGVCGHCEGQVVGKDRRVEADAGGEQTDHSEARQDNCGHAAKERGAADQHCGYGRAGPAESPRETEAAAAHAGTRGAEEQHPGVNLGHREQDSHIQDCLC